jgi:hypothetical protein
MKQGKIATVIRAFFLAPAWIPAMVACSSGASFLTASASTGWYEPKTLVLTGW